MLVFWGWAEGDSAPYFERQFQPVWLLVVCIPELLFVVALVGVLVWKRRQLTLKVWYAALGVMLIAAVVLPRLTAAWTSYHVLNAFPR